GHAFLDAYRATGNPRYLTDAKRASDFVDARGWSGDGMWWETRHESKSEEALGAATALSAEIYEETGNRVYLDRARTYINWANHHAERALRGAPSGHGLYLNFWDGSSPTSHPSTGVSHAGQILTHGATIELFAWLAAVKPPQG